MNTLTNDSTGKWRVSTATSNYTLDLDTRIATRHPKDHGDDEYEVATMRLDGHQWDIVELIHCEVGDRMTILATGIAANPNIATIRNTTPVTDITPITESE